MQPLPHHYKVSLTGGGEGYLQITSPGLTPLLTAAPAEFDGPGNMWSPETLMMAAVADCFALTFRAIALVSGFRWTGLVCDAEGVVDRVGGTVRFTAVTIHAQLRVPFGADIEKARRLLEKARNACLIGNSLKVEATLESEIHFEGPALAPAA
jgi:organic hydroperoxide reductase OsmC/OhrA